MFTKRTIQLSIIIVLLFASFAFTSSAHAWRGYCGSTYVVRPGDWMAKIARNCGVTLSQMYAANPGVGSYIWPGQVLNIPGGYSGGHRGGYYCGPSYSPYYGNYYVVCRGDTLSGIARYYGVSTSYLQWRNGITYANWIYAGQFIYP